ncbi:MAG TPA: GGDEF domain-containing protein [Humidesulfovibrio sp.]|uniref:GGDEF domain-containing protein n=1 Tax=Humidesulfovibrio sp. TaxID=2910988 RepID=UPI002C0DF33B|nr:GGDEF domain-containing protein [Humidesulfovibrio sp.]HWR04497.1 GGDEF domain-containing protein [Humidesulfovibrio sp.]
MATSQEHKNPNGLEAVQETLARLGVAGDADWMALVLFARNLVSVMDLFTEDQKAQLQARVFEQMAKRPLDQRRFRHIVQHIQTFLLDNQKMSDLRSQLAAERQGFDALYEEMGKVFTEIQHSTQAREHKIQRMGAATEQDIAEAESPAEVLRRLRGMITDMVSQAREEARSWQERARQLEHTANFDPLLSELYSRRALDAQLSAAQERCRRSNTPMSLMFLDVDNFKTINDTHGHQVGDGVLRVLAAILSAHAMSFSGYAARFGGEELVILCEGLTEATAVARAEDIRQDVARCPFVPHLTSPETVPPLHVTVSIGVAQIGPGQNASDLVLAADQAMYAAKTQGRNRVVAHGSLTPSRTT